MVSSVKQLRRPILSTRAGYAVAASVIGLGLFASTTPSPLYRSYSVLWHFAPLTLTLVYATYAFGVLASLLLVGSVSVDVGRRPVLLTALALLMGSTILFALADSAACLGLGVLVSSTIVQLGRAPLVLPYVILLVLFALAFAGVYLMPEPVTER